MVLRPSRFTAGEEEGDDRDEEEEDARGAVARSGCRVDERFSADVLSLLGDWPGDAAMRKEGRVGGLWEPKRRQAHNSNSKYMHCQENIIQTPSQPVPHNFCTSQWA